MGGGLKLEQEGKLKHDIILFPFKVVDDFQDQQLAAVARSLLNHGAKPVSPKVKRNALI